MFPLENQVANWLGDSMPDLPKQCLFVLLNILTPSLTNYRIDRADIMSISLAYFFWELSRQADLVKRLHAELNQATPDHRSIPDISCVDTIYWSSSMWCYS